MEHSSKRGLIITHAVTSTIGTCLPILIQQWSFGKCQQGALELVHANALFQIVTVLCNHTVKFRIRKLYESINTQVKGTNLKSW